MYGGHVCWIMEYVVFATANQGGEGLLVILVTGPWIEGSLVLCKGKGVAEEGDPRGNLVGLIGRSTRAE